MLHSKASLATALAQAQGPAGQGRSQASISLTTTRAWRQPSAAVTVASSQAGFTQLELLISAATVAAASHHSSTLRLASARQWYRSRQHGQPASTKPMIAISPRAGLAATSLLSMSGACTRVEGSSSQPSTSRLHSSWSGCSVPQPGFWVTHDDQAVRCSTRPGCIQLSGMVRICARAAVRVNH